MMRGTADTGPGNPEKSIYGSGEAGIQGKCRYTVRRYGGNSL